MVFSPPLRYRAPEPLGTSSATGGRDPCNQSRSPRLWGPRAWGRSPPHTPLLACRLVASVHLWLPDSRVAVPPRGLSPESQEDAVSSVVTQPQKSDSVTGPRGAPCLHSGGGDTALPLCRTGVRAAVGRNPLVADCGKGTLLRGRGGRRVGRVHVSPWGGGDTRSVQTQPLASEPQMWVPILGPAPPGSGPCPTPQVLLPAGDSGRWMLTQGAERGPAHRGAAERGWRN